MAQSTGYININNRAAGYRYSQNDVEQLPTNLQGKTPQELADLGWLDSADILGTGGNNSGDNGNTDNRTTTLGAVDQKERDQKNKDALTYWNESAKAAGFPQDLIDLGSVAITGYSGDVLDVSKIVDEFNKIKSSSIDPYFRELADVAMKDFKTQSDYLNTNRGIETEQEQAAAAKAITDTQASLESRGMTFSGDARKQLGATAAYSPTENNIPGGIPFAGTPIEGTVNQANRLISTSSAARYANQAQTLGRQAEDMLGTSGAAGLGINYTPAGVSQTGKVYSGQQSQYGNTLQQIINNYRTQNKFNLNNLNQ
jgi:hypothetical protein